MEVGEEGEYIPIATLSGVWRWGKRESVYLSLYCHHLKDSCIEMGRGEGHFNVSLICEGQSHN